MTTTGTGFLDNLASAARENPLAAALIGGGALWLLLGNEKLRDVAGSATAAASPLVDVATRNVRAAASGLRRTDAPPTAPGMDDGSFDLSERMGSAAGAAIDAMSETAQTIKNRFNDGAAYARQKMGDLGDAVPAQETFAQAKSSLAEILERQPLVLGMVGMAIGAAVGASFRASDVENEWLGDISDEVKADLSTRAGAVSERVRAASETLKAEVGDTGAEAVDRLKQACMDAANAARDEVKSS